MNRNEFMTILQNTLGNISPAAKDEIMYDYVEHFEVGLEQGLSEAEISTRLGDPRVIAKQYRAEYMVRQADTNKSASNVIRAIFAALSLGFLNLTIMLPILAACAGVLISFYTTAAGLVLGGIGAFIAISLSPFMPQWISVPDMNPAIIVFSSISLTSLGLLIGLGTIVLTKLMYKLTISYIKANIKIIGKKERERENYV